MAAGYLGMIEAFDPATEEWGKYIDRFQQFLVVNDVKDPKKQAACLITVIGASTYKLLENLLSPEKPAAKKLYRGIAQARSQGGFGGFERTPPERIKVQHSAYVEVLRCRRAGSSLRRI